MKTTASANFLATLTICAIATALLVGCQKAAETTATPPTEIRGEAISAPVVAPAKVAAQTPPAPAAAPVAAAPAPVPAPAASAPTPVLTAPAPATVAVAKVATPSPPPATPPATPPSAPAPAPVSTTVLSPTAPTPA